MAKLNRFLRWLLITNAADVLILILLLLLIPPVLCCIDDEQVAENLNEKLSQNIENNTIRLSYGLLLEKMEFAVDANSLHLNARGIVKWQDLRYNMQNLDPCKNIIEIKNVSVLPVKIGSYNGVKFETLQQITTFSTNGTFLISQNFQVNLPCSSHSLTYPFGSVLCTAVFYNEKTSKNFLSLVWDSKIIQHPFTTSIPIYHVNDLRLTYKSFQRIDEQNAVDGIEKLILELQYEADLNKLIFLFYFPSILIVFVCWMSMLLGPMAITRATMNVGALLLLYFHYTANMANLPQTFGISAIDIWKVAMILFVVASFFELVVVSCMASIGRSRRLTRCCRGRRPRKRRYEMEPLYEELNDLRQRRPRTTCSCCRYSALTVDIFSLFVFAASFMLFTFIYFKNHEALVVFLNGVETSLIIP